MQCDRHNARRRFLWDALQPLVRAARPMVYAMRWSEDKQALAWRKLTPTF
jgi:hypothetical protein